MEKQWSVHGTTRTIAELSTTGSHVCALFRVRLCLPLRVAVLSFLSSFVQLSKDVDHKHVQGRNFGIVIMSYDIATALGEQLKKVRAHMDAAKKSNAAAENAPAAVHCLCSLARLFLLSFRQSTVA
jgi:hypothetical protein